MTFTCSGAEPLPSSADEGAGLCGGRCVISHSDYIEQRLVEQRKVEECRSVMLWATACGTRR